jgi:hypothetical protein
MPLQPRVNTNLDKTIKAQDQRPINRMEKIMARCVAQFVFKPNPGADMAKFRANVKTVLVLWKKYGAETSFWSVTGGEVGHFVVSCVFPSAQAYGECMDKLAADPEFQAWSAHNVAAGLSSWVRSNIAREVLLD